MSKKFTIKYVKEVAEKHGYKCLSNEYINIHTHLKFKCPANHIIKMTFDAFKSGQRCSMCYGNKKKKLGDIKEYLKKYNYDLLSKQYKNSYSKLKILCPLGHEFEMTWDSFKFGYRCNICGGTLKKTIEEVKEYFKKFNYKCLTTDYQGANKHLKVKCPENHNFKITWSMFQQGQRCPECYRINNYGPNSPNWRGGKSFEDYCYIWNDKEFRNFIRERDGKRCLNPACSSKNPFDINLHHINYIKNDCDLFNIITLCRSCNASANFNRKWHKSWYQAIIYRRYICSV